MQEKTIYKGIEFVRLGELPREEKELIKNWLGPDSIIRIKTSEKLFVDCLLYKEYKQWYENIYTEAEGLENKTNHDNTKVKSRRYRGLAFD